MAGAGLACYLPLHELPPTRRRLRRAAARSGRSLRATDHLSARLGHRPLRFPLRLLHVGAHALSAACRAVDARGARPPLHGFHRARHEETSHHRRRAAAAARRHDAVSLARPPSRVRRARRTDAHDERLAARALRRRARGLRREAPEPLARHARSRRNSARSRAMAISPACSTGSRPRNAPASSSRSTRWRSRTRTTDEFVPLTRFAHERGMDISFIEVMPLGELDGQARIDQYLPLTQVRERLRRLLRSRRSTIAPAGRRATARARDRRQDRLHHAAHP